MELEENGLYVIKDSYFSDFKDKHLMLNKLESRPYFYALKESDNIFWMIPLSSKVENYRAKIKKYEAKFGRGKCVFYHIGKMMGKESVFLVGNTIPVSPRYIKQAYTVRGVPYVIESQALLNNIKRKHKKYLTLVKQKRLRPNIDIFTIHEKLLH